MMSWQAWAPPAGWPTAAPPLRWQTVPLGIGHHASLWLFELDATAGDTPVLTCCLSAEERTQAQRFKLPLHGQRHRVGRAMARHILAHLSNGDATELRWLVGAQGKPKLATPPGVQALHFNLSHSGGWALLATSLTRELGVDLEHQSASAHLAGLQARILSPEERLLTCPDDGGSTSPLLASWVRKEACLKALGTGLSREMDTITLEAGGVRNAPGQEGTPHELPAIRWMDVALPADFHAAAALAWLA